MFGWSDEEAWAAYKREEISLSEYMKVRDAIKRQTESQAEAKLAESTAVEVESLIRQFGGVTTSRAYGQVPNPFKPETQSLTNQMVLIRKAQGGDQKAISLLKFLHQEAGIVGADYLRQIEQRELSKAEEADRLLQQTAAMRAANDQRLNRSSHEAFPEAGAAMRARSAGTTPYIPPRGA